MGYNKDHNMAGLEERGTEYPTTLDVVRRKGKEYQVVAMSQTGDPEQDIYVLKNPQTGETQRVTGARFSSTQTSEPGKGDIHKRDEGVRVTGKLEGGTNQG
jgi:hypothetical protein